MKKTLQNANKSNCKEKDNSIMEASPEKWRESSIHGMKLAQVIIGKSDKALNETKIKEPLPMLRDYCIQQSNERIRAYMRATRAVVVKLRRSYAAVNDEMKSVNRCKENLEKALEHKQKDLVVNMESQEIRSHKPLSETVGRNNKLAVL